MPRVEFTDDFNWSPPGSSKTTAYKRGTKCTVSKECAEVALAKKRAVKSSAGKEVVEPKTDADETDQAD